MKKVIFYLAIFTFFCGLIELSVNYSLGQQIKNQSPFHLSFSSIGANLLESRLDCWAKIKTTSSAKELDQNLINILQQLQLPADLYRININRSNNGSTLKYECKTPAAAFQFILQLDQKQKETCIFISILSHQQGKDLPGYERKLKSLFACTCYYQYSGYIGYALDSSSRQKLLQVVMKQMEASSSDIYQENNTTSVTAYSRKLQSSVAPINVGFKPVNIQAALRTSQNEKRTYVYIGSPVILGEY